MAGLPDNGQARIPRHSALVQTATKPKDRTAKGLIPDAEAGKEVIQNARQARTCKLVLPC
uniref:Uncharacterized protein n=1 Tax=Agrobacterium tumefaciens TaxID=358 RepID=A0A2Z2PUZ8_AGRTU|nr:hypothetical protein [Agrobacterium tumefaciens]